VYFISTYCFRKCHLK